MKERFPWWLGTMIMAGAVAAAKSVISASMFPSPVNHEIHREPIYGELTPRGATT